MQIGTQIVALGNNATTFYTPWFPKQGDNAVFAFELISSYYGASGGSFACTAYTKNREDLGSDGTATIISSTITTGFYQGVCTDLKELVRFKITVTPGSSITGAVGATYRFLPPTWYDTAI